MEPGRLIASGRDADIFEFGPDLVLRRTRGGRSLEREAGVMAYAAEHGFPVPAIHELRANDTELVMERVPGPLMVDAILKRPWTITNAARTLADLHDQLHEISAPDGLPQLPDGGTALVHLDLHPLNVIVHPVRGPVVIDWANASRGEGLSDVALTYVLITCPRVPGSIVVRAAAAPLRSVLATRVHPAVPRSRPRRAHRDRGRAQGTRREHRARRSRDDEQARRPHARPRLSGGTHRAWRRDDGSPRVPSSPAGAEADVATGAVSPPPQAGR